MERDCFSLRLCKHFRERANKAISNAYNKHVNCKIYIQRILDWLMIFIRNV
jgi:hypothetical protein